MDINKRLEDFDKILRVDVPDALWSRINESLQVVKEMPVPVKVRWMTAAAAILILSINITTILSKAPSGKQNNPISEMGRGILENNSSKFYND